MRVIFLSAFIAMSTALAVPSASYSANIPVASADPRIQKWAHMKIAMPDGVDVEDTDIIPVMEMDFPAPSFSKKSFERHDTHEKGYKMMELIDDEKATFNLIMITPLQTEEQKKDSASDAAPVVSTRRYRKFLGVKDTGEAKVMNIPTVESSITIDNTNMVPYEETNPSVREKTLVGVDNFGRRRYLDIPYYNRAANVN